MTWKDRDDEVLLELLAIDTVSPVERGRTSRMPEAQALFARHAVEAGLERVYYNAPPKAALSSEGVPTSVLDRFAEMGEAFLANQPNAVFEWGKGGFDRTIMFNIHLDTVSDLLPVRRDGDVIHGRGAVDVKGLAVALLVGIRDAVTGLRDDLGVRILVQAVSGEEGGAMGVYGTRHLVERGYVGRLNVVVEPTELGYLDRSTAAMTARVSVDGVGSTDDEAASGQNATILLAAIAHYITVEVAPLVARAGGRLCVAGICTGHTHNRVSGSGSLLLNIAYDAPDVALAVEEIVERGFHQALDNIEGLLMPIEIARVSAEGARKITRLTWLKRRLPTLANRDPFMEEVLAAASIPRHDESGPIQPFTCDAIWLQGEGRHVIIYGAGGLGRNGAHTDCEFVHRSELIEYATGVTRLIAAIAAGMAAR